MRLVLSSTSRRVIAAAAALLSALGTASIASAEPDPSDDEICAGFVYLDKGKLEIDDEPYQMNGVNFVLTIGANEQPGGVDAPYEYFLAPSHNARPDNNAICTTPAPGSCCTDATSCGDSLQTDIDALSVADFNSVRLLFRVEWDNHRPRHRVFRVNESQWSSPHYLYLDNSTDREIALDLIERQVNWLGVDGVRSILLTGSFDHGKPNSQLPYIEWLEHLSARLENNPYLIAYDPQNEPLYQDDYPGNDPKLRASTLSHGWFDAITSNDPRHLVTVGLGDSGTVFSWDPQVIWDHVSSYHIYPPMPWDGEVHGSHSVANDVFYAAQNACGEPCPFGGDYDGANCLVVSGPVGSTGSVAAGEFRYTPVGGSNPCPVGQPGSNGCVAGSWIPVRDQPFTLPKTIYYVIAQNGTCPPGGQYDGSNCVMHGSPPGATPFVDQTGFYYDWLSGAVHCQAPAWDDGTRCKLGDIPAGWSPFYLQQPLFYLTATACGPKKPIHLGETGFTVMPYPGGNKDFWAAPLPPVVPTRLLEMKSRCERASNGPIVDSVVVGGTVYEAENGAIGGGAQVVTCTGCTGTGGVSVLADGHVTIAPSASNACRQVEIRYRSPYPTKLQISTNGKPPVWISLSPAPNGATWTEQRDFSIGGADTITLSATAQVDGDFAEQTEYVQGGNGWDGLFPYSNACGFQGMHWWMYGSNSYYGDTCADYGLNTYWYHVESRNENVPDELLFRPVMTTLRDDVDYLAAAGPCDKPAGFNVPLSPWVSATPRYTYHGKVKLGKQGLPYVPVQAWFHECITGWASTGLRTFTDETGAYTLVSEHPIAHIRASHFGYTIGSVDAAPITPGPNAQVPDIHLSRVTSLIVNQASLNVPSTPGRACWQAGSWVVQ